MSDATEILLSPGDILFREGDLNECGYIIETGEVILYKNDDDTRRDCERRLAGAIVGELSLLIGRPRAVTVEAVTDCRIYKISAEQILKQFNGLDPVLRTCVESSIRLAARIVAPGDKTTVPLAENPLQDASALIEKLKFESDILKGIQRDEFSMRYQPIVSLADGYVVGCEALMRWEHPSMGDVSPDKFITAAEDMGAIGDLTDFALSEACATLKRAQKTSPHSENLFMSVNVSGSDIGRSDFVDHLAHLFDIHDLAPRHLKLEVTETALVPSGARSQKTLQQIKDFGCGLSIDDFGTGYSNLAYLKSLPLTALKIDRAFAGDAHANAVSKGIVRMLVGLGSELDVDVIAEGLETSDDVATLRGLGCQYAQGFYFHKPLFKNDYLELVRAQSHANPVVA